MSGIRTVTEPTSPCLLQFLLLLAFLGIIQPVRAAEPDGNLTLFLTPKREAVLSAEIAAVVAKINIEVGQRFKAGEDLIRLQDDAYRENVKLLQTKLRLAKAHFLAGKAAFDNATLLKMAKANLKLARTELKSVSDLNQNTGASLVEVERAQCKVTLAELDTLLADSEARIQFETVQARLTEAELALAEANRRLSHCRLSCPFPGRVVKTLISEYELAQVGQPLIKVINDEILVAKVLAPAKLYQHIRVGASAIATIKEAKLSVPGKVSHVNAMLDAGSESFEFYLEIDNGQNLLRAGMSGHVTTKHFRKELP